jgi:integrase
MVYSQRNQDLAGAYLDWAGGRLSPYSARQYAQALDRFLRHLGSTELSSLTLSDIEEWLYRPNERTGKPKADSSIKKDAVVVQQLLQWCVARGHLRHDVTVDLKVRSPRNSNPHPVSDEIWIAAWATDMPLNLRLTLGLGYFCGLRREEICQLQREHLDMRTGRLVNFKRKGDRNGNHTGALPVASLANLYSERRPDLLDSPDVFLDVLSASLRAANPYLLSWGVDRRVSRQLVAEGATDPDQLNQRMLQLARKLKVERHQLTPHSLRHSFVTNLISMGIPLHDVSALANHSSITITQRYLKIADDPIARHLGTNLSERWPR